MRRPGPIFANILFTFNFDRVDIGEAVFNPASCSVNIPSDISDVYFKDFVYIFWELEGVKTFSEKWQPDN